MASTTTDFPTPSGTAGRYQPLVLVVLAAAAGIVFDRLLPLPLLVWCTLSLGLFAGWGCCYWSNRSLAAALCLLLGVAALAAAWHHGRWSLFRQNDLGFAARAHGTPVCVRGFVAGGPRQIPALDDDPLSSVEQGDRTQFVLRVRQVRNGDRWQPAAGRAWVMVDGHVLGVHAGDEVQIFGQLVAPRRPANPGDFDAAKFHRRQRRLSLLRVEYSDGVSRISAGSPCSPARMIEWLRNHFRQQLSTYLSDSQSPLAMAVLLGAREQLNRDKKEAFLTSGTIHLMAISGLHVSILVSMFLLLGRAGLLPNSWAMGAAMAVTILYALVADPRPPVVRATILTWMMCIAWSVGRDAFSFNTLAAAALVVLALNPADLFHVGAQLSFLAVGTLACFAAAWSAAASDDPLKRLLAEARPWPARLIDRSATWLGRLALASFAVWAVAAPLVAYNFHVFSPIAVVLTPLLWIPVTLLLYSGFGVLVFGWLFPPAALLCGWICDGMLALLTNCVHAAQHAPGSHFWVPGPAPWWLAAFYGGIVFWGLFPSLRPPPRWCAAALVGWLLLGAGLVLRCDRWIWPARERLEATFVSVGHGTSVLLELPDGQTLLYDAGGLGSPRAAAQSISAVLWSRGWRHLDAVVLSHADADHYNALPRLLDRFSIDAVYVSPMMLTADDPAVERLFQATRAAGVPVRTICAGSRLHAKDRSRIEVLHPPEQGGSDNDNANSVVLLLEFAQRHLLLPGDLDGAGMDTLLHSPPADCDIVMAPHHGRLTNKLAEFLQWSSPEWTIVSAGLGDDPTASLERLAPGGTRVLHTGYCGAIRVTIEPDQLRLQPWRKPTARGQPR